MRGLIRRAAVAAVAYLGLLLSARRRSGFCACSRARPGRPSSSQATGSASLANGSWSGSGSVQTGPAGKERK